MPGYFTHGRGLAPPALGSTRLAFYPGFSPGAPWLPPPGTKAQGLPPLREVGRDPSHALPPWPSASLCEATEKMPGPSARSLKTQTQNVGSVAAYQSGNCHPGSSTCVETHLPQRQKKDAPEKPYLALLVPGDWDRQPISNRRQDFKSKAGGTSPPGPAGEKKRERGQPRLTTRLRGPRV